MKLRAWDENRLKLVRELNGIVGLILILIVLINKLCESNVQIVCLTNIFLSNPHLAIRFSLRSTSKRNVLNSEDFFFFFWPNSEDLTMLLVGGSIQNIQFLDFLG